MEGKVSFAAASLFLGVPALQVTAIYLSNPHLS